MASTNCATCRAYVLSSFIRHAHVPAKSSRPFVSPQFALKPSRLLRSVNSSSVLFTSFRQYSSTSRLCSETTKDSENQETASSTNTSNLPWYLQVQTPEPLSSSFAATSLASQEIPPIPEDAPQILEPILRNLSISIGLDNLTLIDLRDLDPPAALGSNLLMIIGTARSHKHLNTSADRFCRWVRSTYGLRPYADGLLGRNEMKLKLRRKNRKMKLAQSVGNTLAMAEGAPGADDGITTGWICCNMGPVDEVEALHDQSRQIDDPQAVSPKEQERVSKEEEEYQNPGENHVFAGFGQSSNAPKIVVQMFVEEKRLEMDLEGLWESRIQRRANHSERANIVADESMSQILEEIDEAKSREQKQQMKSATSFIGTN